MDAVYSGQAGTLALIEGANVELAFAALPERSKRIAREGVRYVFLGCNDIVTVRGANRAEVFSHFMKAWRCDRSLRLFLLLLDSEEDVALREEAADCLEEFFTQSDTIAHVENQLYSRPLPINADLSIIRKNQSKWPNTSQVVLKLTKNQDAIHRHREAWDKLPESLFGDVAEKIAFEEEAIERGAFRTLAITPSNAANLAILACHKALASLPEGRHIVSEWTKGFKKSETKTPLLPEDDIEPELQPLYSRAAFENALRQQEGIFTQMRSGNLVLASRFADQLVDFQLGSGGDRFAAKSLCRLAQEAKYLGLFSLQLEWAQRATVVCPADAWAHGQAADALLQYFRLDEALAELELCESYGDAAFAATGGLKFYVFGAILQRRWTLIARRERNLLGAKRQ